MIKSAATLRAEGYNNNGSEWFCGFTYTELKGIGYQEGIHRRDPSSVIQVDDIYYVWYTKSWGSHFGLSANRDPYSKIFPWDHADIWYATSSDGIEWQEIGCAVARGESGAYDERTVCTPEVLAHEGRYYLVYQAVPECHYSDNQENTAMAVSDRPSGPFIKLCENILKPMEAGEWFGDKDNYNTGLFKGVTHDPSLHYFNNRFYLYYKCGSKNDLEIKHSGPDTRWGVATSDVITGPYTHSDYNPISNSGHETMLWEYDGGIACLINRDGPEKETIQYAKDGFNFEIMSRICDTPQAGGPFRGHHNNRSPLEGIRWGLCHADERNAQWNYLLRFDLDMRQPYEQSHQYPMNSCTKLDLGWGRGI